MKEPEMAEQPQALIGPDPEAGSNSTEAESPKLIVHLVLNPSSIPTQDNESPCEITSENNVLTFQCQLSSEQARMLSYAIDAIYAVGVSSQQADGAVYRRIYPVLR